MHYDKQLYRSSHEKNKEAATQRNGMNKDIIYTCMATLSGVTNQSAQ